jgi:3-isopropylmalate/(R)-2-methylmalate dehydratase large subunit
MGMTIVENIMSKASGGGVVRPGDVVMVKIDTVVLLDSSFTPYRREILKVFDPDKIVIVYDHMVPAPDEKSAHAHQIGREFARKFGIKRFFDVGPHQGISHAVVADYGFALPGTVLVCPDSHTCAAGAFNCAARGTGAADMTYAVTMGKTWFRIGETVRYELEGELRPGVSAKDVFLHIAGYYGDHTGQNVEFGGPGLATLSINSRRTLATMGAELSAEFVTFDPDDRLIEYMKARNPTPFEAQRADPDAKYAARHRIDLGAIEPLVALPDAVIKNSVPVGEVAGQPINQAFIGSCANGTLDDIAEAARVVKGKQVAPTVRFIVTPGSQQTFRAAMEAGYVQTLMEAGAVVTPATCGACFGGHMGVLGPDEVCITASTRNFKGRMGHRSARIYMASPATVAASAIAGRIVHPGISMEASR